MSVQSLETKLSERTHENPQGTTLNGMKHTQFAGPLRKARVSKSAAKTQTARSCVRTQCEPTQTDSSP